MPQGYTNLAQSTLASGYTAGNNTLVLQTGDGVLFSPATTRGIITVGIGNPPAFFLTATGVSSDTLTGVSATGTEGTTAVNVGVSTPVTQVITTGALDGIRSDISQIGTYASLPSSGMIKGDRYRCTDSMYEFIYNGTIWVPFVGEHPQLTIPPTSGWTWANQGSSSVDSTKGYLYFKFNGAGSDNLRAYTRTLPSTPYTMTIAVKGDWGTVAGGSTSLPLAIVISDGTKYIQFGIFLFEQQGGGPTPYLRLLQWSNTSTSGSSYNNVADVAWFTYFGRIMWLQLVDDGTNLTWNFSFDGVHWTQFDQRARTNYLTPSTIGVGSYAYTGSTAALISCNGI
jgi:hypothetical protein